MNWEEEMKKFDARYQEILESDFLTKKQKQDIKSLKQKLEGYLYDPQLLVDWVTRVPFEGIWEGYGEEQKLVLRVVGVLESVNDFYYIGFNQEGKLYLVLCNDHYEETSKNAFYDISLEDMKSALRKVFGANDRVLMFRTDKNDKELIK
jgi:hypothetical protein